MRARMYTRTRAGVKAHYPATSAMSDVLGDVWQVASHHHHSTNLQRDVLGYAHAPEKGYLPAVDGDKVLCGVWQSLEPFIVELVSWLVRGEDSQVISVRGRRRNQALQCRHGVGRELAFVHLVQNTQKVCVDLTVAALKDDLGKVQVIPELRFKDKREMLPSLYDSGQLPKITYMAARAGGEHSSHSQKHSE